MQRTDLTVMQKAAWAQAARTAQKARLRGVEQLVGGRGGGGSTAPTVRYEPLQPRPRASVGHHTDAGQFIRDRRAGHDRPEPARRVSLPVPKAQITYVPVPLLLTSDRMIQGLLDKWGR